jgi:deoxyribodipyrimidine photo-lyase
MTTTSLMVFTRDLRVTDNPALASAAEADHVVPLFVLDDVILNRPDVNATRLAFLLESLLVLDGSLKAAGARLVIRRGSWASTVAEVASLVGAERVHLADDVSGYAKRRLAQLREAARLDVITHPGVTVAGPERPHPASGGPYQVFSAYYRQWAASPRRQESLAPVRLRLPDHVEPGRIPKLSELTAAVPAPGAPRGGEQAGRSRLSAWTAAGLGGYDAARDDLAGDATSRLSPYLHFGCLSPLAVAREAAAEPFVRQLAWRDFFCQLLDARPDAARRDYKDRGDQWHDDADGLAAWKEGQTGYPVVDAAMRQLRQEGFMHNRARMIVASFLTKDLYIDWREGAAHFMGLLADADVACNQLNWQWVAGTGTDRQPHRIFNPVRQSQRFDPRGEYIARYVPELAGLSAREIHDPPAPVRLTRRYPAPIVDHHAAAAAWRARQGGGPGGGAGAEGGRGG